jgi:hypothetical protein
MYQTTVASSGSLASNMLLSASLSWTTTPTAATSNSAIPIAPDQPPDVDEDVPLSMASTAWPPVGPRSARNCAVSDPRTASAPKNKPAIAVTMSSSGPSENTE